MGQIYQIYSSTFNIPPHGLGVYVQQPTIWTLSWKYPYELLFSPFLKFNQFTMTLSQCIYTSNVDRGYKNKFLREGGLRRVRFVRKMILYVNCLRVSATCTWHELCCLEQNTSLYQISEDNNLRIIAFQLVQGGKEEQFKTLTVDRAIFSQPLSPTL